MLLISEPSFQTLLLFFVQKYDGLMCEWVRAHMHVEAGGWYQTPSSVIIYIFWGRTSHWTYSWLLLLDWLISHVIFLCLQLLVCSEVHSDAGPQAPVARALPTMPSCSARAWHFEVWTYCAIFIKVNASTHISPSTSLCLIYTSKF